ncbi:hypothetical protein ACIG5E_39205 [Kitasatospora sp. NPDC053057]|uniref:hypothetical protein n=1 Tax=Kitasatospora sp. NPDC053057 TaxID=3364062 RepID=UPI0037CA7CA6
MRTYRYRVQRNGFGLFLGIAAEATRPTNLPVRGIPVSDRVRLNASEVSDTFHGNRLALNEHEVAYLQLGLRKVSSAIERIETSPYIVISVRALEIVEVDYVEEALAPAIAGWAAAEFSLTPRPCNVSRDSATGRFTFDWDE